jgi:hypothetical protein
MKCTFFIRSMLGVVSLLILLVDPGTAGAGEDSPAGPSAESRKLESAAHPVEAYTLSDLTNRLDQLSENAAVIAVLPYTDPSAPQGKGSYTETLLKLGIPILEVQQDGSFSLPQAAGKGAAAETHRYSFSTRQLETAQKWLRGRSRPGKAKPLELKVQVEDDAEELEVRRLELGAGSDLLWFIFEEQGDGEQRNSVEVRLPF